MEVDIPGGLNGRFGRVRHHEFLIDDQLVFSGHVQDAVQDIPDNHLGFPFGCRICLELEADDVINQVLQTFDAVMGHQDLVERDGTGCFSQSVRRCGCQGGDTAPGTVAARDDQLIDADVSGAPGLPVVLVNAVALAVIAAVLLQADVGADVCITAIDHDQVVLPGRILRIPEVDAAVLCRQIPDSAVHHHVLVEVYVAFTDVDIGVCLDDLILVQVFQLEIGTLDIDRIPGLADGSLAPGVDNHIAGRVNIRRGVRITVDQGSARILHPDVYVAAGRGNDFAAGFAVGDYAGANVGNRRPGLGDIVPERIREAIYHAADALHELHGICLLVIPADALNGTVRSRFDIAGMFVVLIKDRNRIVQNPVAQFILFGGQLAVQVVPCGAAVRIADGDRTAVHSAVERGFSLSGCPGNFVCVYLVIGDFSVPVLIPDPVIAVQVGSQAVSPHLPVNLLFFPEVRVLSGSVPGCAAPDGDRRADILVIFRLHVLCQDLGGPVCFPVILRGEVSVDVHHQAAGIPVCVLGPDQIHGVRNAISSIVGAGGAHDRAAGQRHLVQQDTVPFAFNGAVEAHRGFLAGGIILALPDAAEAEHQLSVLAVLNKRYALPPGRIIGPRLSVGICNCMNLLLGCDRVLYRLETVGIISQGILCGRHHLIRERTAGNRLRQYGWKIALNQRGLSIIGNEVGNVFNRFTGGCRGIPRILQHIPSCACGNHLLVSIVICDGQLINFLKCRIFVGNLPEAIPARHRLIDRGGVSVHYEHVL